MVSLYSVAATGAGTPVVLADIADRLPGRGDDARFVYAFYGCSHDDAAVHAFLRARFPRAAFVGGTSCAGVMSPAGLGGPESIGFLVIEDADGAYGSAAARLGDDAAATAAQTLRAALADAGCPGQLPELIWIFQTPGREEDVIEGLRRVVGDRCPIIGGSAADDTVEGNWRQIAPQGVFADGLAVAVLFTSDGVGYSFQGGYEPAGHSGIVTRVGYDPDGPSGIVTKSRGREIVDIDGQPAAVVYNDWIGRRLADRLPGGGNILLDTTMCPLAIDAGEVDGIHNYLLIHPEAVLPTGGIRTFASVDEGTRVYSMRGDKSRLVERAGRVAAQAAQRLPDGPDSLAGGLMVYCAGCMLAVDQKMPEVVGRVAEGFAGMPFLGCFTFGEQGLVVDRNMHGNLMISAIAFGR
ncbi:MAG: FIST signal transduction protein [Rhodospirillales bacterium]